MTLLSEQDHSYQARAAEQVRSWILDGTLAAGSRINEVTLSQQLGISRGPLREALQQVAAQGLIHIVRHRGSFVREFTADEIDNLYEVRIALERAVASRLARTHTDEDLGRIDDLLRRTARTRRRNGGSYPEDLDFHATLAALCGNPELDASVRAVSTQLALARGVSGKGRVRADVAVAEHQAIAAAIAKGDGRAAAAAMRTHLERSHANTLAIFSAR